MADLHAAMEACVPYLVMTLVQLAIAILLGLLKAALDPSQSLSATVLVFYQLILSSLLISSLAHIFERRKRPKLSFRILCWAFLIAFLQFPLGQLMSTASLRYITATFVSVAMNTMPVIVFLLVVASGRERFRVFALHGQAKLWGILVSAAGATVMVVLSDDSRQQAGSIITSGQLVGYLMVGAAVIAVATSYLLVERVALDYPAHLTLSALMSVSGAIQIGILALFTEKNITSWRLDWKGSLLQLICILFGGIITGGLSYCATNWCNHKKGPAFVSAFYPVLIFFSFIIETFILKIPAHLESIIGVALVIGGLYLFFWAKSQDYKAHVNVDESQIHPIEVFVGEPLLQSKD